jgi:hypothetical protein
MKNPDQEYDRLHDHMTAIARERDHAVRTIDALTKQLEELKDALVLAHEAMRRAFPENQQLESDKWRNIAGNLYDEMRMRAAECLYRHEDGTKDCVKDYELADEQ